jgi:hypothetical protein
MLQFHMSSVFMKFIILKLLLNSESIPSGSTLSYVHHLGRRMRLGRRFQLMCDFFFLHFAIVVSPMYWSPDFPNLWISIRRSAQFINEGKKSWINCWTWFGCLLLKDLVSFISSCLNLEFLRVKIQWILDILNWNSLTMKLHLLLQVLVYNYHVTYSRISVIQMECNNFFGVNLLKGEYSRPEFNNNNSKLLETYVFIETIITYCEECINDMVCS